MPDCCINLLATAIRIAYEGNPCSHLLHPEFVEGIRVSSATMHQDPDTWKKDRGVPPVSEARTRKLAN